MENENVTGRTTLIKMIYAACEWSNENAEKDKSKNIIDYFNYGKRPIVIFEHLISADTKQHDEVIDGFFV